MVKYLIDECRQSCHPPKNTIFLPTRLIDIGTSLGDIPCLVCSRNLSNTESLRYAALSYCWGTTEDAPTQLKTESSTLEDRYTGIPIETMTRTIVDAIHVAHALEIRYLWIDSLCIIQDDVQD